VCRNYIKSKIYQILHITGYINGHDRLINHHANTAMTACGQLNKAIAQTLIQPVPTLVFITMDTFSGLITHHEIYIDIQ